MKIELKPTILVYIRACLVAGAPGDRRGCETPEQVSRYAEEIHVPRRRRTCMVAGDARRHKGPAPSCRCDTELCYDRDIHLHVQSSSPILGVYERAIF